MRQCGSRDLSGRSAAKTSPKPARMSPHAIAMLGESGVFFIPERPARFED